MNEAEQILDTLADLGKLEKCQICGEYKELLKTQPICEDCY